jgi:Glutathione S-transferase, N-terminal domain
MLSPISAVPFADSCSKLSAADAREVIGPREVSTLILYYWPGASSMAPHVVLEEIGAPYERQIVNLAQGEHKSSAYLAINPRGIGADTRRRWRRAHGKRRHPDLFGQAVPGR